MTVISKLCTGFLTLALAAAFAVQPVSFNAPQRDFPAGSAGPSGSGDFNGDGKLDIVVSQGYSKGLGVLLGNGDGTFQPPINSPGGVNALGLAVGDFNGDGKLDVVIASETGNTLAVWLGNGDGTFQAPVNYTVPYIPFGVAVADLNKDGIPDLVTVGTLTRTSAGATVLLGKGDGTFQAPTTFPTYAEPTGFVVADFNHDGNLDVAVASDTAISMLLGTGTGSFQPYVFGGAGGGRLISAGDLNGDGNMDLVLNSTARNPTQIYIALGNGDGTFQTLVPHPFVGVVTSIADVNHDGKLDLVGVSDAQNTVLVLLGNGDGTFPASPSSIPVGLGPNSTLVGTFRTGGTAPDVVTANSTGSVSILLNKGDGTFPAPAPKLVPGGARSVVTADLNGDGFPDLVTADKQNVSILLGKGDGTFHPAVSYRAGGSPAAVVVGDFNNDGKLDLAVCNDSRTNVIAILLGNGDGTFQPALTFVSGTNLGGTVAAADFNQDGKLDLVVNVTANNALLFPGNGDGTFQSPTDVPLDFVAQFVATADLNHDGKPDLIAGGSGNLSILIGQGDGTFQLAWTYTLQTTIEFSPAMGDLNGDGHLDLVIPGFSDTGAAGVSVMLGLGRGNFQEPVLYPVTVPVAVTLADLNHDGFLDVAIANTGDHDTAVMLGNGDGTLGAPTFYPSGGTAQGIAAGDFNQDHRRDLAVAGSAGVIVLVNKTQ